MKRRTVMAAAAGAFAASALPLSRAAADDTRSQLASMTLDQKIGQVLWTHVFGASADDASMARKNQLAFGDDVRTPLPVPYRKEVNLEGIAIVEAHSDIPRMLLHAFSYDAVRRSHEPIY